MKFKYILTVILLSAFTGSTVFAQQSRLKLHFKDKSVLEYNVDDIDSISFSKDDRAYTPVFKYTNITNGTWAQFEVCKGRLFAVNVHYGLVEYKNGIWEAPADIPSTAYGLIKEHNGRIFIADVNGVYLEKDNGQFERQLFGMDMKGALGGSDKNYFLGSGTYQNGIYRLVNDQFVMTNQNVGTWYSIESLGDDVFFGAGATHIHHVNPGIVRWDEPSQMIVPTNISDGVCTLAKYKNAMYASGAKVWKWNGTEFVEIYPSYASIRVTGDHLYIVIGGDDPKVMVYDDATETFQLIYNGFIGDIKEHDGKLYVFGNGDVKVYNKETQNWDDVETDNATGSLAFSCEYGLFVANHLGGEMGILKMEPKYDE